MYIYGYCYNNLINRHKYKKIKYFCDDNNLNISEIFSDSSSPRYDYIALKSLLSGKDILILADVEDLGKNKKQILEELALLASDNIRIVVLNKPDTQFSFPGDNADEIEKYYDNIKASNYNLLEDYAASTNQNLIEPDTSDSLNCRIIICGKEIKEEDLKKPRPSKFLKPGTKAEVLISNSRTLAHLKNC